MKRAHTHHIGRQNKQGNRRMVNIVHSASRLDHGLNYGMYTAYHQE